MIGEDLEGLGTYGASAAENGDASSRHAPIMGPCPQQLQRPNSGRRRESSRSCKFRRGLRGEPVAAGGQMR